jgi:ATP-binding cassette subfamily F protein 3
MMIEKQGFSPSEGTVYVNGRLRIAFFTQHAQDQLILNKNAVENMVEMFPGEDDSDEHLDFRRHLGRFLISGNMAKKPLRKLSGGEKSRVAFAVLTWRQPHIIVLDEPTNHLDMETIDALIGASNGFDGGMVFVSHDVHFLSSCCKELYLVEQGKVERFDGTIFDYKKKVVGSYR